MKQTIYILFAVNAHKCPELRVNIVSNFVVYYSDIYFSKQKFLFRELCKFWVKFI